MEMTYSIVPLEVLTMDEQGHSGVLLIRGKPGTQWLVPYAPVESGEAVKWRLVKRGDKVYVPVFPYIVAGDPTAALGYMFQLGAMAVAGLPAGSPPRRLHLAVGDPVNVVEGPDGSEMWQIHLGFGVII